MPPVSPRTLDANLDRLTDGCEVFVAWSNPALGAAREPIPFGEHRFARNRAAGVIVGGMRHQVNPVYWSHITGFELSSEHSEAMIRL